MAQDFDSVSHRLRWLFTRRGLPTLIPLLALIASVTFNLVQLRVNWLQSKKLRDLEPSGTFRTGQLMDEIIRHCQYQEADPPPPLRIVADFAAYGAFSHPEKFSKYLDELRRRADGGLNVVSYNVLTRNRREEVFRLQFKDFEAQMLTEPFRQKVVRYMVSDRGRAALAKLGLEEKALKPEDLTFDEWVSIGIAVDDLVIEDLRKWGIQVRYYPHLLTMHAWSGTRNQTLFAIVDLEGAVDEAGFISRGDIANQINRFFEIVEKGARPQDQDA